MHVTSPFAMDTQQIVYVTSGEGEPAEKGVYSFEELYASLMASKGRALVLFTAREELDWAAEKLMSLFATGEFPYPVFVQEHDSNRDQLAANFKANINSVLIATRSFFTGFDAPGETLSNLVICKFPMPRLSTECRQQMAWWRMRGYKNWYQRKALTDWEQGAGRLIRSSGCRGVVTLLDTRTIDPTNNINMTARMGVRALGSPVVRDLDKVAAFLNQ
jgi:Rad3-related DNA helicase